MKKLTICLSVFALFAGCVEVHEAISDNVEDMSLGWLLFNFLLLFAVLFYILFSSRNENIKEDGEKSWRATALLCLLLGVLGAHRFYVDKTGTGLLQLFTFGGLSIWTTIDLILILCKKFKDKNGEVIK